MKAKERAKSGTFYPPVPPVNPYHTEWTGATLHETKAEKEIRLRMMAEAVKTSKEIDEILLEDKKAQERRRKAIKMLLLGQSESGKSSLLKRFQIAFAPKLFESERPAWKVIIQLNIIATIKTILNALKEEFEPPEEYTSTHSDASNNPALQILRRLPLGLSPLFFIEANLLKTLAPECSDSRDMCVRAGSGWKTLLRHQNAPPPGASSAGMNPLARGPSQAGINQENDPTSALTAQRDDIIKMWRSPDVQEILRRRRPQLELTPGFFMNDLERIATTDYVPTDSDIILARMKTIGIEEHRFKVGQEGSDSSGEFYITDLGGTRNQRASWVPFFDDVQVMVFLAPLAFNQSLEEDSKINRLEDSFHLWRDVCGNRLLSKANLILVLNKINYLNATLAEGVQVREYVPSYHDLPNDVTSATKYFRDKFRSIHRQMSVNQGSFFCYAMSAIDRKSVMVLVSTVRDTILGDNIRRSTLF